MSFASFIASDYPLPKVNLQTLKTFLAMSTAVEFSSGFAVEPIYYDDEGFINKKYKYNISLETDNACVESLRQYLIENMKNESEVEVWSIWVGGDYTKHYKTKISFKHTPVKDFDTVNDDVDWYTEFNFVPKRRSVYVSALTIEDISFVLDNSGVCLVIKN